jgi:hypothetical protein
MSYLRFAASALLGALTLACFAQSPASVVVDEARLTHLAYAPEIA